MLKITKIEDGIGNYSSDETATLREIDIHQKKIDCLVGRTKPGMRKPFL